MTRITLETQADTPSAPIDPLDDAGQGSSPASRRKQPVGRPGVLGRQQALKQPQDTAAGCRDRATADLLASITMSTPNARLRMETSAASWTLRADLLDRLQDGFARRRELAEPTGEQQSHPVRL